MTTIVNKYHKVSYDIYIGRPSKWSNPFSHLENTTAKYKVATREEAIEKYKEYIMTQPQLLACLWELKNKTLCCYCAPKLCHGNVLIDLINEYENDLVGIRLWA